MKKKAAEITCPEGFPIAGIGASAGGLEAFRQLLSHLPSDTGMAFLLVQHLNPDIVSALPELLARATSMPVCEAKNRMRIEPNHVYVIQPNRTMGIKNGALTVQPRPLARGAHHTIDFLFESLAQDLHECAIGVILSGTASDGTVGLEAIKAEGGITLVQDESAKYLSMPRSAIAAGCVDFVLSPKAIAAELARLAKHPYLRGQGTPPAQKAAAPTEGRAKSASQKILLQLLKHAGVDFSVYKPNTIQRRISRRMLLGRFETAEAYATALSGNAAEIDALFADLLIGVTSFFRNPEAYATLKAKVFPRIVKRRLSSPIRVWTLGCSTGQEAYSIAMALVEYAEKIPGQVPLIQIYATDLNEAALNKARHGLYAKNLVAELSPERLRRFFVEEEGGFRVSKKLRDMCVFARHNLIADPSFSRMDLISCRNLLIYIEPDLQRQILPVFHYALKPDGFLFLGASESVSGFAELFEPVDKHQKIFARKPAATPTLRLQFAPRHPGEAKVHPASLPAMAPAGLPPDLAAQREADRILLTQHAPPAVLINAALQVLQFRGATDPYLTAPPGKANFQVLQMAREGLMIPLREILTQARKENRPVRKKNIRVRHGEGTRPVSVLVTPLKNVRERYYLISFEEPGGKTAAIEIPESPAAGATTKPGAAAGRAQPLREELRRIAELERELAETRDYSRSLQEQYEASSEEIQATSEEMQSGNEELQSINEELETSKEELESSNEELITVNEEMAHRNAELNQVNSDLNNLHVSIHTAILVLGRDLTIRRFTPAAEKLFNLVAADRGRPLSAIRGGLNFPDLEEFVTGAIAIVALREREVQDRAGRWYLMRARPYVTLDNTIDGAVLVLIDIDALKQAERAVEQARDYSNAILRAARDPMVVLRPDLRVNTANDAFYRLFQTSTAEATGNLIYEVGQRDLDVPELRELLANVLPGKSVFNDFQVTLENPGAGRRTMSLNARPMPGEGTDSPQFILLALEDISERERADKALRESEAKYRALFDSIDEGFCILEKVAGKAGEPLDFRYVEANAAFAVHAGEDKVVGRTIREAFPGETEDWYQTYDNILRTGEPLRFERELPSHGRVLELFAFRVGDDGHHRVAVVFKDITIRKQSEDALRRSEERFRALVTASSDVVYQMNSDWSEMQRLHGRNFVVNTEKPNRHWLRDYIHPDDQAQVSAVIDECVRTRSTFELEHRVNRADGTLGWTLSRAIPILDADGAVIEWFGTASDISGRKLAEEALRESAQRLRFMAESVPQKIFTARPNGDFDYFNRQWIDFTGLTFEQSCAEGWKPIVHPGEAVENARRWKHAIDTGESFQFEHRIRRHDGIYRWHLTRARAMRDADREVLLWIGSTTEIEDQKQAEENLEAIVAKRTAELRDTIGELEAFSYSVSHDMRAPLRALRGFSDMVVERNAAQLDVEGQDYLKRISAAANRMDQLIEDVLNYSRVLRAEVNVQPVRLDPLVSQIIGTYPQLQAHAADIHVATPLPVVLGHEASLTQCISNLLSNAVKFVAPGVRPQVKVWAEPKGGDVRLWIEDHGIGIDPADQQRIFAIFERVVTREAYEGTGIGLAIVRKAVERMHGRFGVESARDQGSRFWIELPSAPQ